MRRWLTVVCVLWATGAWAWPALGDWYFSGTRFHDSCGGNAFGYEATIEINAAYPHYWCPGRNLLTGQPYNCGAGPGETLGQPSALVAPLPNAVPDQWYVWHWWVPPPGYSQCDFAREMWVNRTSPHYATYKETCVIDGLPYCFVSYTGLMNNLGVR